MASSSEPAAAAAREINIRVRQQEPAEEHPLTVQSDVRYSPFPPQLTYPHDGFTKKKHPTRHCDFSFPFHCRLFSPRSLLLLLNTFTIRCHSYACPKTVFAESLTHSLTHSPFHPLPPYLQRTHTTPTHPPSFLYARVQVEVTALKAMLEAASGVPASRQRLICRGRVLKDTQRLSELRVEDGDTLHMVRE
jgi:hypothetical protein